jgi:hypothetical protein
MPFVPVGNSRRVPCSYQTPATGKPESLSFRQRREVTCGRFPKSRKISRSIEEGTQNPNQRFLRETVARAMIVF